MGLRTLLASLILAIGIFSSFMRDAQASLVWGERDDDAGKIELAWARGASQEEAINLLRAHIGEEATVLLTCRDTGWFAFVGSSHDSRRGFSCGFDTEGGALFKARKECEIEGGACEIERLGFDAGSPVLPSGEGGAFHKLPGAPNEKSPVHTDTPPLVLQKWGILDY